MTATPPSGDRVVVPDIGGAEEIGLESRALGLGAVLMQSVTHVAPAIAILLTIQFVVGTAGMPAPIVYVLAGVIIALVGISFAKLARAYPSAGGYFTYISRSVHPRAGFLTSWMYVLWSPIAPAFNIPFLGYLVQEAVKEQYDVSIPWWPWLLIIPALVAAVMYYGVKFSVRTLAIFGIAEIVIVLALAIWGFFDPGRRQAATASTWRCCSRSSATSAGRPRGHSAKSRRTRSAPSPGRSSARSRSWRSFS
jgi:amino acid transporter